MKPIAVSASAIALAGTIVPACLYVTGRLDLDAVKVWMLASTIVWFVATPAWMQEK